MAKHLAVFLTLLLPLLSAANPLVEDICQGATVVSESLIGKDKNVQMSTLSCPKLLPNVSKSKPFLARGASASALNVCGKNCTTNCFIPSGGGPNPNECNVIADALRYESQNTGAIFQVQNGTTGNSVLMTYRSCKTFFTNQDLGPLEYCRTDWADLVDYVAFNCQATQNAHGGNCIATDQRWFVQVQTATT
ncbi:hypothetical protein CPB83DRAFT_794296 [Crepidotus variabilis]|uniref:Uncharacterized protein n=1 Tax=Crepidotus variabilis TaxID=179855 RepID=A0A9P6JMX3_9AGAR|nr:hypothetical protein CPB83DRAFT_794296 [Crepidotus variabilis]